MQKAGILSSNPEASLFLMLIWHTELRILATSSDNTYRQVSTGRLGCVSVLQDPNSLDGAQQHIVRIISIELEHADCHDVSNTFTCGKTPD